MGAPLLPLTLGWTPPPKPGRTWFVVCAYHGRDRDAAPRGLLGRLESAEQRGHRIVHRDHYANPRPFEYQMAMIGTATELLAAGRDAVVAVDRVLAEEAGRWSDGGIRLANVLDPAEWRSGALRRTSDYDHLVLVYADALGLGCEAVEKYALRGRSEVLVINGRRRAFRLTPALRRRLDVSRFLAQSRLVERGFAAAAGPVAATLATIDRLRGRS
jgi:hypothetical protein